jgi:AcrR family transcriptional regulator
MLDPSVREQILAAAKRRFFHYGYAKTTMAELARDCNMSAGNLYRYFPSKLDIAEAIATETEDRGLEAFAELARRPGLRAREKLREFLFLELRSSFNMLETHPKALEMAEIISHERPQFANRRLALMRGLLAEILAAGNASGEFRLDDVIFAAEMIQSATMKFYYPQLWTRLTLEKLERELAGVFELLMQGLTPQRAAPREPAFQSMS